MLFDLLKLADSYFLDCLAHDTDDTRTDRSAWYYSATFGALSSMNCIVAESVEASTLAQRNDDYAWSAAREERQLCKSFFYSSFGSFLVSADEVVKFGLGCYATEF